LQADVTEKKTRNKYNIRKEKEIISFQEKKNRKRKLNSIHTKTIFFPYVHIETEEERTYIEKRN